MIVDVKNESLEKGLGPWHQHRVARCTQTMHVRLEARHEENAFLGCNKRNFDSGGCNHDGPGTFDSLDRAA